MEKQHVTSEYEKAIQYIYSLMQDEMCIRDRMCMPGDNVEMTIELIHPIAMSQGLTFAIREGGRTVGSGRVATIIE